MAIRMEKSLSSQRPSNELPSEVFNAALIDGDVVVYKAGFSIEERYYGAYPQNEEYNGDALIACKTMKELNAAMELVGWGTDDVDIEQYKEVGELSVALARADEIIYNCMYHNSKQGFFVFLSGSTNFRNEIDTGVKYKGNRSSSGKPDYYDRLREHLLTKYSGRCFVADNCEADDMLGIYQNETNVICSIDKDLMMIPGCHYNLTSHERKIVSKKEAICSFYRQILTGDATDNIIGIRGLGPKTAEKIVHPDMQPVEMWAACVRAYEEKEGRGYQEVLNNARLLWIQRKHGQVWEPPT